MRSVEITSGTGRLVTYKVTGLKSIDWTALHTIFEDGSTNLPDVRWEPARPVREEVFELSNEQVKRKLHRIRGVKDFYVKNFRLAFARLPYGTFLDKTGKAFRKDELELLQVIDYQFDFTDKIIHRSRCTPEHEFCLDLRRRQNLFTLLMYKYSGLLAIQQMDWK